MSGRVEQMYPPLVEVGKRRQRRLIQALKLFGKIAAAHPLLSLLWIALPCISGLLIVPLAESERRLIDAAVQFGGLGRAALIQAVWLPLLLFAAAAVGQAGADFLRKMTDAGLSSRAELLLKTDIQNRAWSVPLDRFEQPEYYDRLSRAQTAASGQITGILSSTAEAVKLFSQLAGMLIVVYTGHFSIAIMLFTASTVVLLQRLKIETAVKRSNRELTSEGRMSEYLKMTLEDPAALKELKLFGAQGYMKALWDSKTSGYVLRRSHYRKLENRMAARFALWFTGTLYCSLAIMMVRIAPGSGRAAITAGTVAIVFQTILQAQGLVMRLSWPLSKLYVQSAAVSDLTEFLDEPVDLVHSAGNAQSAGAIGPIRTIQFEHVSYRYPGAEHPVLKGLNVTLQAGEMVALAGDNGAGKSTFILLMLGLLQPTEGKIMINSIELSRLNRQQLWTRMSAVFQEGGRYPLTLKMWMSVSALNSNLANDRSIRRFLEECGLPSLLSSKEGLDLLLTEAREGGRELSGGQWQRLSIARAMLRGGDVIAFDEPTSAIDPVGELELFNSCCSLSRGKLAVFVSHRLGWARYSDRIIVLKKGVIVEDGRHDELMEQRGCYYEAFKQQASWYEHTETMSG
jgi:ATP-binding cassette subfamily B protein